MADIALDQVLADKLRASMEAQDVPHVAAPFGDHVYRKLQGIDRLGRQVAASLLDVALPSPTAPIPILPAGLEGLYALANDASQLVGGPAIPGGERATNDFMNAIAQSNSITGATPFEMASTDERNMRAIAGAIMPGPKLSKQVPAVVRGIQELAVPLLQSREPVIAVTLASAASAVNHAAAAINDEQYSSTQQSDLLSPEQVFGVAHSNDFSTSFAIKQPATPEHIFGINQAQVYDHTPAPETIFGIQATPSGFDAIVQQVQAEHAQKKEDTEWGSAALAAGATALLIGGVHSYNTMRKARLAQTTALSGVKAAESPFSAGTMLKADTLDSHAPIYAAVNDSLKPYGAHTTDDIVDALRNDIITSISPHANAAKTQEAMATGFMPGSATRGPRLATILESLATLPEDAQKLYDDALTARDKAQQMHRENAMTWGTGVGAKDFQDLAAIDSSARANPIIDKMMQDTHVLYRTIREYMHENGFISKEKLREWNTSHNNYVPNGTNFDQDPLMGLIRQIDPNTTSSLQNTMKRLAVEFGQQPGDGIRPSRMHTPYLHSVITAVENNRIRTSILDAITANPQNKFARRVAEAGNDTQSILRNGKLEHYKVDPILGEALKFKPANARRIYTTTKQIMQSFTTGKYAPYRAPISAALENGESMFSRRKDMGLGLVSEVMNRSGMPTSVVDAFNRWVPVDPTAFLAPAVNTVRGVWSDALRAASRNVEVSLNTNGTLSKILGPQYIQRLSNTLADAYVNTMKHQFMKYGGGAAPVYDDLATGRRMLDISHVAPAFKYATDTGRISPENAGKLLRIANAAINATNALVKGTAHLPGVRHAFGAINSVAENLHSSTRLQHFASNVRPGMSAEQLTKIAGRTRELTGDVGQRAGNYGVVYGGIPGWASGHMNEKVPYYNITVQATRAFLRGWKENLVRNAAILSAMTYAGIEVINSINADALKRDIYWNQWTPEQRAEVFPPMFADDGSIITQLPMLQILQPYWSAVVEGYGAITGAKAGNKMDVVQQQELSKRFASIFDDDKNLQDLLSGVGAGIDHAMPRPIAPIHGAVIAGVLGKRPDALLPWHTGGEDITNERITPDGEGRIADSIMRNRIEAALNELIGGASSMLVNSMDTVARMSRDKYSIDAIAKAGMKQFTERPKDTMTILGGEQMWDWEKKVLAGDTTSKLISAKMQKLQELSDYLKVDKQNGSSSSTPRPGIHDVGFYIPAEIAGTKLGEVAGAVKPLYDWINKFYQPSIKTLYERLQAMPANTAYASNPIARREQSNQIVREIRALNAELLGYMTDQEDIIGNQLGIKHFRLNDIDPNELKKQGVGK